MTNIFTRLLGASPKAGEAADRHHPPAAADGPADQSCDTAKLLFWRMARRLDAPVGQPHDHRHDPARDRMVEVCRHCAGMQTCRGWMAQKHPPGFPVFCPNAADLAERAGNHKP